MTQTDDSRISHSHILPPKNGGGPYIAACVVFALLIVGLLWFKFSPSKPSHNPPQPAQIPEPTASAEAKPAYPDFDIPAPPAINSAAADPVNPSKPATATVPNLCAGPCQGTIGPAQKSAIDATSASARGCYEQALRNNPSLEGRIVVATRIAANGNTCSARIIEDSVRSPQVSSCILNRFTGKRFQPFTNGLCVDVNVPLSFQPK